MNLKIFLLNVSLSWLTFALGFLAFVTFTFATKSVEPGNAPENKPSVSKPIVSPLAPQIDAIDSYDAVKIDDLYKHEVVKSGDEEENSVEKFYSELDINGFYYFTENLPRGFSDFDSMEIWLETYDEKLEEEIETTPYGFFKTRSNYKFDKFYFANGRLEFSTEKIRAIKYEFSGRYEQRRGNEDNNYETQVLRGTITKWKSGEKIAESSVELGWHLGC